MAERGATTRMREFFKNPENAGETLNYADLVTKFDFADRKQAKQAVYILKMEGLLCSEHLVFVDPERPR